MNVRAEFLRRADRGFCAAGEHAFAHVGLLEYLHHVGVHLDNNLAANVGAAPATTDLIGGHVQVAVLSLSILQPHVKAGRLRAIARVAGKRAATMPAVPAMAEAGYPDVNADNWFGMLAPVAIPKEVSAKLHAALAAAADAETKERLSAQGVEVALSTPENFTAFLRHEYARWGKVIRAAGIRAD